MDSTHEPLTAAFDSLEVVVETAFDYALEHYDAIMDFFNENPDEFLQLVGVADGLKLTFSIERYEEEEDVEED